MIESNLCQFCQGAVAIRCLRHAYSNEVPFCTCWTAPGKKDMAKLLLSIQDSLNLEHCPTQRMFLAVSLSFNFIWTIIFKGSILITTTHTF